MDGGFFTNTFAYREHALVLEVANRLGRLVKWANGCIEHSITDFQGRYNVAMAKMEMDSNSRFVDLRVELLSNFSAYVS